jgi:hypothetical protein
LKSLDSDERIQGNPRQSNTHQPGFSQRKGHGQENPNGSTGPMTRPAAKKEPARLHPNAKRPSRRGSPQRLKTREGYRLRFDATTSLDLIVPLWPVRNPHRRRLLRNHGRRGRGLMRRRRTMLHRPMPSPAARVRWIGRERRIGRIRRERRIGRVALATALAMALMMTVVVIVMVALAIAIAATIAVVVVMPAHVDLLIRSWKNSRRLGPSYLAMPIEPPLGMPIAAAMV